LTILRIFLLVEEEKSSGMKKISFFTKFLVIAAATGLLLTACQKMQPLPKPGKKSLYATIASEKKFEFLKAAVIKAGLVQTLNDRNASFTVFAPVNEAFMAAGFKSVQDVANAPADVLKNILLYHVLAGETRSTQLPVAANTPVSTALGKTVYVTRTSSNNVFVNGVAVIWKDVDCTNGIIHVIDRVLMPPPGNLVALAQSNPNLSFLVAAVLRASQGATPVATVLSTGDPLTVFAPTNEAFMAAGFKTVADINNADPDVLAGILTYHVIAARVFSSDLTNNAEVPTVNGEKLLITLTNGAQVKGKSNSSPSDIIATDIVADNGVVHVINQVLLP
jgi:uncharacterized surface protein with fasciclin (FAS1) repeats